MADSHRAELRALIENEISLGFTFLETASIAGSEDHRQQARSDAVKAYETAQRFIARLPADEIPPEWVTRLGDLKILLTAEQRNM